jgi:prepilin-type N-terminal cleavage/methylation domain-containing protein
MKRKNNSAFSLIELAIVIIVIGILIAGVTQGRKIITLSAINSARALTKSSPVNSLDGLLLWLDTTSKNSFPEFTEIEDGDLIGTWEDINPMTSFHHTATQSTLNKKPEYVTSALGSLPAIKFNGNPEQLIMSQSFFPTGRGPYFTDTFSVFIVAEALSTHELDPENTTSALGTGNQKYVTYPEWGMIYNSYVTNSVGAGISFGTNGISFYEHTNSYMPALMVYGASLQGPTVILSEYNEKTPTLYVNGNFARTGLTSPKVPFLFRYIGGNQWGYFLGYVGEIIVFDRVLKASDRNNVNDYLKQKWNIS